MNEFPFSTDNNELKLLLTALDASISGITITDPRQPDNPIIYCNKAFENITGYSKQEIIGFNCRFLQGQFRDQLARDVIRAGIENRTSTRVDIRNVKKNGDIFWNELYVSPVFDDNQELIYFIGVQNDITRRVTAELELKREQALLEDRVLERTKNLLENQEYLDSILNTIRESLLILDSNYTVLTATDHFYKKFQVEPGETVGTKLFDLGNGQWNIQSLRVLLEQILPTNNPVLDFEVEAEFPHIGRKLMLLNAHRIEHEGEFKNRILLSIEDITQQRESDNRKDDFISIASHELKTPLTALKGYLEVASYALKNGKEVNLEEMIDQARLSSVRLNDLLNDLLRMSKLKHEHLEINQSLFSFDEVVDEAVNMLKVSHTSHTINITARCNKHISGDRNRILQVISNLVNNAIKYSPGRNAVEVHATCHGNYVKLSVIDQGQGIPLSDQTKIFNRFFRSGVHEKSFAGMGIGLFISREIIQAHGGTIWVEKSSNLGTTFSFTLPLKQADAE